MLAYLMSFDYADQRSLDEWDINHSSDHEEIRQAIQAKLGVNLEDRPIYPTNWKDWNAYAIRHQSLHNDMNSILGLNGVDLTTVDFKDKKESENWHFDHFQEHQAARTTLGI